MENFKPPSSLNLSEDVAENWKLFKQRFQIFLEATEYTKKSGSVQVAMLLNTIGDDGLQLFNTFNLSNEDRKDIGKVLQCFEDHCIPRKNQVFNRYKFFNRNQAEGESFDNFLTDLKKIAKICEFEKQEESLVRDKIILGIRDRGLQEALLREADINLEKASNLCRAAEVSKQQVKLMREGKGNELNINKLKIGHSKKGTNSGSSENGHNDNYQCKKCGKTHAIRACPAYGLKCNQCGRFNHFKVGCKQARATQVGRWRKADKKGVNELDFNNERDEPEQAWFTNELTVRSIKSGALSKSWTHAIMLDNRLSVDFKIDTGADINVLPYNYYKTYFSRFSLKETNSVLIAYGGTKIETFGIVKIPCKVSDSVETSISFVVAKVNAKPILGLSTAVDMNLVKRVNNVSNSLDNDNIFTKYKNVFLGLGKLPFNYKICLSENAVPTVKPARRYASCIKEKLQAALKTLEDQTIISKVTRPTDWVNDIIIVEKKNGSIRICLNPSQLNKVIKREHHVIPTMEELRTNLAGKKVFSVLDMKDGFHQIPLDDESSYLCTFATPFGRYKYNRLPFGLSSSPEIFQRELERIFGDLEGVQVYFDDLIIAAEDEVTHDKIFSKVMDKASQYNVKFNYSKIQYKVGKVMYLGLIFNEQGVRPDSKQLEAIAKMPNPVNKKELQRFLGLVNYFHSFIPKLSELTNSLRLLLRTNQDWQWTNRQQTAVDQIKLKLINITTLKHFNPKENIVIQTDASNHGIGCALLQNKRPVAFASRSLNNSEKNYSVLEKELLAIVFALNRFHQLVYGHNVLIETDHKPLISIFSKCIHKSTNRIQRLKLKVLKYQFTVKYLPGAQMVLADHLSRSFITENVNDDPDMSDIVHSLTLSEFLSIPDKNLMKIAEETKRDLTLTQVIENINQNWSKFNKKISSNSLLRFYKIREELYVNDDILMCDQKIVVPISLQNYLLSLAHGKAHLGIVKCKQRLRKTYYWPSISQDIEHFVKKCRLCEHYQKSCNNEPLLQHEIPKYPFHKIGIDIAEYAKRNYLIVVDYLSKWLEILPLNNKTITEIVSRLFPVFATHGMPKQIICDNVPFNSSQFRTFCNTHNIQLQFSSLYYAKSNGLAERGVGIAKLIIKKCNNVNEINEALLDYRATPVAGVDYSPSQILMSRLLNTNLPIKQELLKPKVVYEDAYSKLSDRNVQIKLNYDKKASERPLFQKDQNVALQNPLTKLWEPAKIITPTTNPRSYMVQNQHNKLVIRNSKHIRTSPNALMYMSDNVNENVVSDDDVNPDLISESGNDKSLEINNEPQQNVTRSGRHIQKPSYLNEFVK
ncbi:hypothetical protein PPYR_10929 [Photinus pyralis]|uniref:RNA-directed DNA polymerase n=1 Tax=Photinus pyralis TaxID=7054 RepID=A0A5N4AI27_PHOPY|nr:uncharacterized protein K02A2.6-like isoform X1 [Photinus pyralis]XP_031347153.1 uncharacterized protein K02A2.6-like isoform X2 [Photinus pyralis]KAB0796868.1 hypothetical protein PPYR_10929 [Photinus pyralis]